jgi:ParB-like chromosome segregation protein Spo0J
MNHVLAGPVEGPQKFIRFQDALEKIAEAFEDVSDDDLRIDALNFIQSQIRDLTPLHDQPVSCVMWVPIEKVEANDYNPNTVAAREMQLLQVSIDHDGYTQPVVTIYDDKRDMYVIVDGFHRYFVMKSSVELRKRTHDRLPVVVIDKAINDRMASTIRHNRARGKHSIDGMSRLVFKMLDNGWADAAVCNELGMEAEELIRLKHITGFSKLFADIEYRKAWVARTQIRLAREAGVEHVDFMP